MIPILYSATETNFQNFGIGTLSVAKHPALHSLAEVTIIGMGVVVLMAWIVPPLLFDWLVSHDKSLRDYILIGV